MIDIKVGQKVIIILTLTLSSCSMNLSTIESHEVYITREFGFSQAVVFNQVIYGSGQIGWDKDFKLPRNPTFSNQFEQTLQNIEHLLNSQGCGWQDILHLRFFVVELNAIKTAHISRFLHQTYPNKYAPATTLLGVSSLAQEGLQVEIEFTAKINKK